MFVRASWRWSFVVIVAGLAAVAACSKPKPAGPPARLDFSVKDLSGKVVKLADFKGRPMILNFWATYCVPCKAEMPDLIATAEAFKDSKLVVLGISVDDTADEIKAFQAAQPHAFPANYPLFVGYGQDDMIETYQAAAIPISWLVRGDGTMETKAEGAQTKAWFVSHVQAMLQ